MRFLVRLHMNEGTGVKEARKVKKRILDLSPRKIAIHHPVNIEREEKIKERTGRKYTPLLGIGASTESKLFSKEPPPEFYLEFQISAPNQKMGEKFVEFLIDWNDVESGMLETIGEEEED